MKKLKFNIRKGFTLVECIIAIAVFAIMTSMVLMIMASTVKLSKRASESEAGLNQLVQNVVQDSSNKIYSTHDSKTLNMKFSGAYSADFAMSYSTVDGARNMFRCPSCSYEANSMEFLNYLYSHPDYTSASDADKKRYKLSHWFDPSVASRSNYVCPECGTVTNVASVNMMCISCERTGTAKDSFIYDNINGGYSCPACNSGKVVQLDATSGLPINQDMVNTNYDFKISSIQSNAIRYAHIEEPTDDDRKEFMHISAPASPETDTFTMQLDYAPSTVAQAVGVYTLRISGINYFESGDTASIVIYLPGGYVCTPLPDSHTNVAGKTPVAGKATASWTEPDEDEAGKRYTNTAQKSKISITGIETTNLSDCVVKFTLTNYKNNQSFEDDFENEGGLMKFWFGHNGNTMNFTNPPPEPAGP